MLHGAGRSQQLFAIGGYAGHDAGPVLLGDDGNAALLFVGDLDRDGRPDLIFDASDHYNVARPTLFLFPRRPGRTSSCGRSHSTNRWAADRPVVRRVLRKTLNGSGWA